MDIKVRNVDPVVVRKLSELAKKHHLSREEYLRRHLTKHAILPEVVELDERYNELVYLLVEKLEQTTDVLEKNSIILDQVKSRIDNYN